MGILANSAYEQWFRDAAKAALLTPEGASNEQIISFLQRPDSPALIGFDETGQVRVEWKPDFVRLLIQPDNQKGWNHALEGIQRRLQKLTKPKLTRTQKLGFRE